MCFFPWFTEAQRETRRLIRCLTPSSASLVRALFPFSAHPPFLSLSAYAVPFVLEWYLCFRDGPSPPSVRAPKRAVLRSTSLVRASLLPSSLSSASFLAGRRGITFFLFRSGDFPPFVSLSQRPRIFSMRPFSLSFPFLWQPDQPPPFGGTHPLLKSDILLHPRVRRSVLSLQGPAPPRCQQLSGNGDRRTCQAPHSRTRLGLVLFSDILPGRYAVPLRWTPPSFFPLSRSFPFLAPPFTIFS